METAPPTPFHFSASESALRAVRAPASRTISYVEASRLTDPSQAKVSTIQGGGLSAQCGTVVYSVPKSPQSTRSPECGMAGGGAKQVAQDGFNFTQDTTSYIGDAYNSSGTQYLTHVTNSTQALNITFPNANMTVTEPGIAAESVPMNQWVQVYDSQVYISSNLVDAWISGNDGNAYQLHDNRNQTMTVTNSSNGYSFTVAFGNFPAQYAMGGRNALHAACAVGWAAAGAITAVAFMGGVKAARVGGAAVLLFPGGGYVEAGIFALGAAFAGWAAYHHYCSTQAQE